MHAYFVSHPILKVKIPFQRYNQTHLIQTWLIQVVCGLGLVHI